jgi:hypothetical protein
VKNYIYKIILSRESKRDGERASYKSRQELTTVFITSGGEGLAFWRKTTGFLSFCIEEYSLIKFFRKIMLQKLANKTRRFSLLQLTKQSHNWRKWNKLFPFSCNSWREKTFLSTRLVRLDVAI